MRPKGYLQCPQSYIILLLHWLLGTHVMRPLSGLHVQQGWVLSGNPEDGPEACI